MDPQIKAQLRQTINVATLSSVSASGAPTYATPTAVSARVGTSTEEADGPDGRERVTRHELVTENEIAVTSVVWLPADASADPSASPPDATKRRKVLRSEPEIGERGDNVGWATTV